jgi:hypothetical protein
MSDRWEESMPRTLATLDRARCRQQASPAVVDVVSQHRHQYPEQTAADQAGKLGNPVAARAAVLPVS